MKAKEYLNQVGIIDARLKMIDANIARLRKELASLDSITINSSWPDGQPHGTIITDPTSRQAVKLADTPNEKREQLKAELLDYEYKEILARSRLWSKRMEVIETLSLIYDAAEPMTKVYCRLLSLKYLESKTWEEIAVDIGYTFRHTLRLHGIALQRLERILNE